MMVMIRKKMKRESFHELILSQVTACLTMYASESWLQQDSSKLKAGRVYDDTAGLAQAVRRTAMLLPVGRSSLNLSSG